MNEEAKRLHGLVFHRMPEQIELAGILADALEDTGDEESLRLGLRFCVKYKVWPTYKGNPQSGFYSISTTNAKVNSVLRLMDYKGLNPESLIRGIGILIIGIRTINEELK